MNSKVSVEVPDNHHVMISFYRFELEHSVGCTSDYLTLFTERVKGSVIVSVAIKVICGKTEIPDPTLYNITAAIFHFVSDAQFQHPGFRILFSFHDNSFLPQQSEQGLWNCSASQWPRIRQHFPCNLETNCINSEDETDCEYVTDRCGQGAITVGDGCYLLLRRRQETKSSYGELNDICRARGGRLASLNTKHEWDDVWRMLKDGQAHWSKILVGLQPVPQLWHEMYHDSFYWADGSVAYYMTMAGIPRGEVCAYFFGRWFHAWLYTEDCGLEYRHKQFLCEIDTARKLPSSLNIPPIYTASYPTAQNQIRCPAGHVTHSFLSCDVHSQCWADPTAPSTSSCSAPLTLLPAVFVCADDTEHVPYTLVCDHRQDCYDNSDELFCFFPPCRSNGDFRCANGQCISSKVVCDGQNHCLDSSLMQNYCLDLHDRSAATLPAPGIVFMNVHGILDIEPLRPNMTVNGSVSCPETHFQCAMKNYYCLPVYLRCNDVYDCPNREDETNCHNYTCAGFYRCRASQICVHPGHLCDGLYQCPQHDDELLCHLHCPKSCTCHGLAFTCNTSFNASDTPDLRYLDAKGSFMTFSDLENHTMLIYLSLAQCRLKTLPRAIFPNLHQLDVSNNLIRVLNSSVLTNLSRIKTLSLSGNPLTMILSRDSPQSLFYLQSLDLSNTQLFYLDTSQWTIFTKLRVLNLSGSGIDHIGGQGFQSLPQLQVLDVRGCTMSTFTRGLMDNLDKLQTVFADNYKLCCPAILPAGFPLANCHAPSNEVSSCDTLLRSDFFRMFLYVFAFMSLTGNAGSFAYRTFISKTQCNQGFSVFVSHLCVSDFLMGLYLTVIGTADRMYQGSYLWEDVRWRNNVVCKMAGFLSLLSCEASTFIIYLITVDRFLVLRFPFSHFHFRKKSAQTACLSAWLTGLVITILPLLPVTAHWQFYKQSSICLPLPVTRQYFKGRAYSFGVMVVLNSILFLLIAMGQAFIYHAIRVNSISMADTSKSSSKELTIARRLITIVMSDFLCWFPIGFLGLLASRDIPIPGEVSVGLAIFVLPLNSALNPFLYTMNVIREKQRQAQFERLQSLFQSQQQAKTT